jgi:hypothetical protein
MYWCQGKGGREGSREVKGSQSRHRRAVGLARWGTARLQSRLGRRGPYVNALLCVRECGFIGGNRQWQDQVRVLGGRSR